MVLRRARDCQLLLLQLLLCRCCCIVLPNAPRSTATRGITAPESAMPADVVRWLHGQQDRARGVKCPFWRRRFGDVLDGALTIARFIAARHKSWELPPELASLAPRSAASSLPKRLGLSIAEVEAILREDLVERQYYITGRLSKSIYADRCCFDGPDPDMPVRDVQRYSDALRGLFQPSSSRIDLIELRQTGPRHLVADWRLEGCLQLPWHPAIKPFTGSTLYELDADGLVCSHTETWDISALDAFVSVLAPSWGAPPAPPVEELLAKKRAPDV